MKDLTTEYVKISLLDGGTEEIRANLGIHSLSDFIDFVAEDKQTSKEHAKTLILDSPKLMRIAFAIA